MPLDLLRKTLASPRLHEPASMAGPRQWHRIPPFCDRRSTRVGLGPVCLLLGLVWPSPAPADMPSWLPRYDLDVELNVAQHCVKVCERVTWTNHDPRPSSNLVF